MDEKKKKYLIYGGVLAAVAVALYWLYSQFGPNSPAAQASAQNAQNQQNAELSALEISALQNPYGEATAALGGGPTVTSEPSVAPATNQTTLASELSTLEQAIGLAPASTPQTGASGAGGTPTTPAASSPQPAQTPVKPKQAPAQPVDTGGGVSSVVYG